MYCTICGNLLSDKDIFCKVCGTATGAALSKEKEKDKISEKNNVFEEIKKEVTAEILVEEGDEPKSIADLGISWNVYEFPKPKKTEEAEFVWNVEEAINAEKSLVTSSVENILEMSESVSSFGTTDPSNSDKFFTFSKKNEEFQKLLDMEYERIKSRENTDPRILKAQTNFNLATENLDKVEESKLQSIKEKVIQDTDEVENVEESHISPKTFSVETLVDSTIQDNETLRKKFETKELKPIKEIKEPKPLEESPEVEVIHIQKLKPIESKNGEPQETILKDVEKPQEGFARKSDNLAAIFDQEEKEIEEKSEGKSGCFLKIIIGIIIVLLVAELGCLGIQRFYPESQASKIIGKTQGVVVEQIIEWVDKIKGSDKSKTEPDKKTDSQNEGTEAVVDFGDVDTTPTADKNVLIVNNAARNTNIQTVIANDNLVYVSGKNYGVSDVNDSKPLKNNGWYKDDQGNAIFYDNEIVGTLMAFGSQWVDYVEEGNKSVLKLTKTDSQAYKNVINSPELGKITEIFYLLEIGEIRKGENGYYIWCHEKKMLAEGGVGTDYEYNWIYYLEPIGRELKVVNYYKF